MNKRVSLRDVAQSAGVSNGTVSNYLNGSAPVSPATRERIQAAIDQLGYRRNELARSLRRSHSKTLGFIIPNITNPFYTAMFDGAEQEARRQGYMIAVAITHYDQAISSATINALYDRQIDGFVIDGYANYHASELEETLDVPVVVIEPSPDLRRWSSIRIDDEAAAQDAVEYLIKCGHKRIAMIGPDQYDARYRGYRRALAKYGLECDPDLLYEFGSYRQNVIEQGDKAIRALVERTPFTACFVSADILAISVLSTLKRLGIRVPDDIAVVGFDDIPYAALSDPPLTTVAQSQHRMGQMAIQILLKQLADPTAEPVHVTLEHQLVTRGST